MHPIAGLDQSKVKALKQEIDRYKHLDHKHIVTYYGGEMDATNTFCVYLEYLAGGSISDLCQKYGYLGEAIAKKYTLQVLKALVYLHSKDVVHGDLKGGNVLLTKDGETVKLCDLGNSRVLEHEQSWQSIQTVLNGTLAWMAPESYESKTGKKSDVWSLGCLCVEMLLGGNPWGKRLEEGNAVMALQRAL